MEREKWTRRRAARRAMPAPQEDPPPIAPVCLYRSFCCWLPVGLLTVLAGIGTVARSYYWWVWVSIGIGTIAAAFHLNSGRRGARGMLTAVGVFALLVLINVVTTAPAPWPLLLSLGYSGLAITATILMWRPEVTEYFRALRG